MIKIHCIHVGICQRINIRYSKVLRKKLYFLNTSVFQNKIYTVVFRTPPSGPFVLYLDVQSFQALVTWVGLLFLELTTMHFQGLKCWPIFCPPGLSKDVFCSGLDK